MEALTVRDRLLDATVACVDQFGLQRFSMEDVAATAGVGRAALYRHFPGGRDQLISEAVTREVGGFWRHLADHVRHLPGLEDRLVAGLIEARLTIDANELLQRLLTSEPNDLLPRLVESNSLVHEVMSRYLRDLLDREDLRQDVDVGQAAEHVTRMIVSHVTNAGHWSLSDEVQVRRLVRTQFLAGIVRIQV